MGAGNESRLTRRKGRGLRPPEDYYNGPLQWLEGADHPGGQLLDSKQSRNRSRYVQFSLKQYPHLPREVGGREWEWCGFSK